MLINLQKRIKYNITSPLRLCTRVRAGRSTSPAAPTASHPQGTGTHIRPGGPQEDPRIDMAGELMIMTGGGDHACVWAFFLPYCHSHHRDPCLSHECFSAVVFWTTRPLIARHLSEFGMFKHYSVAPLASYFQ